MSNPIREPECGRERGNRGISLVELLFVAGLFSILATLTLPVYSTIGQARGVADATEQIVFTIELARNEALARRTFAWVALENLPDSIDSELQIVAALSKNGHPDFSEGNLEIIKRPAGIRGVKLVNPASLEVGIPLTGVEEVTAGRGASFTIGKQHFSGNTITFTPSGEAMLLPSPSATDGFDPSVGIGLVQRRGETEIPENAAAVVIDGATGIPRVFRK